MRRALVVLLIVCAAIAFAFFLFRQRGPREVSMILTNGTVYTVNPSLPKAEAVAIDHGVIAAVGTTKDILARFKADTVIDLQHMVVYPGFIDAHAHLEGLGAQLMYVDVQGGLSLDEIRRAVIAEIPHHRDGSWIRGRGWDQNLWLSKAFPTRADLDGVAPDVPVVLQRVDGHAFWLNTAALRKTNITRSTPDPVGGRILRDASGEATGVLIDNAMIYLTAVLPSPSKAERTEAIRRAVQRCLRYGLTQVHDMGVDEEMLTIYRELIRDNRFPFRVYTAIDGDGDTWKKYLASGPEKEDSSGRLAIRALKVYMDGALGSRGAALLAPYTDEPTNRGLTTMTADSLRRLAGLCLEHGFQLCTHAIGDRANAIVLTAYADAFTERHVNGNDVRFRIEHAQVLDPVDIPRFHKLGVIPMMQPAHCTSDNPWVEDRIGKARAAFAYAWRSLLDDGNIVPGGSDFPVESPDPLRGFSAAITRQDQHGQPRGGWHPEQCMTRDEALKAFTIWASYAAFQEGQKGSIEPGKWADLVVLSDDIMAIEPSKIPDVEVRKTIVAGQIVYDASKEE